MENAPFSPNPNQDPAHVVGPNGHLSIFDDITEATEVSSTPAEHQEDTETGGALEDLGFAGEEEQASAEGNSGSRESGMALNGLSKAIARMHLKRINKKLDRMEETNALPLRIAARNDRKGVKMGKRGAVNYGLRRVHGDEVKGAASVVHDWNEYRTAVKQPKIKSFEGHKAELETKKAQLEERLGISSRPETPNAQDNKDLRHKKVRIASQDAYTASLEAAKSRDTIDEAVLASIFGDSLGSPLARFTVNRLARDGVIDERGAVLLSPDEIDSLVGSKNRESAQAPVETIEDSEKEQRTRDLFEKSETVVETLVRSDPSSRTEHEKYSSARRTVWAEIAYMVEASERSALIDRFMHYVAETDHYAEDTTDEAITNPRQLYDETEEMVKLVIEEDASTASEDEKLARARVRVWNEVANVLPEDQQEQLLRKFSQFLQSDQEKHSARKQARRSSGHDQKAGRRQRREPTQQELNAGSSLDALRNIIND